MPETKAVVAEAKAPLTLSGAKIILPTSVKSFLLNPRTIAEAHWVELPLPGFDASFFFKCKSWQCPERRALEDAWRATNAARIERGEVTKDEAIFAEAGWAIEACIEDWCFDEPYSKALARELILTPGGIQLAQLVALAPQRMAFMGEEALQEMEKNWIARRESSSASASARSRKKPSPSASRKTTGAKAKKSSPVRKPRSSRAASSRSGTSSGGDIGGANGHHTDGALAPNPSTHIS